jgi:hypothetical protein
MKKTKAGAASVKKPSRGSVTVKKSAPGPARTRSLSQQPVAARTKTDQDPRVVRALTDLVEISVEIRELLAQIRDALVEGEEAEPTRVDTVVITETEGPEPSEDEI